MRSVVRMHGMLAALLTGVVAGVVVRGCFRVDVTAIEAREASDPALQLAADLLFPQSATLRAVPIEDRVRWAYLLYWHVTHFDPSNALAHYERGVLLKERFNKPAQAVCAFWSYSLQRPHADKARRADARIEASLDAAARQELEGVLGGLANRERLERLEAERTHLIWRLDEVTTRLIEAERVLKAAPVPSSPSSGASPDASRETNGGVKDDLAPSPDLGIPHAREQAGALSETAVVIPETPGHPFFTVQDGNTLEQIAGQIFGSSDAWTIIYRANENRLAPRGIRKGDQPLPTGLELVIPVLPGHSSGDHRR